MTRRELLALAALVRAPSGTSQSSCMAGVATIDITPEPGLWMAGFARRTQPAQGTALPLKAKALAIQSGGARPAVIVTTDLLGLTARLTEAAASEVRRRTGIPRSHLLFNASHTHCGPVVDEQLSVAYDLSPDQWREIRGYTAELEKKLANLVVTAASTLRPAMLAWARGEARFARNRRVQFSADGPVDHSVPILRVSDGDGAWRAIVFGYACHNTTLQDKFVQYHGDYAGVAQAELERRHPGTTALFVAGCGADANPSPRGTLELVEAHGRALADAVDQSLPSAAPLESGLHASYGTVALPYEDGGVRTRWRAGLDIEDVYLRRYDALMKSIVARGGRLPAAQPAPVQVWQFGAGTAAPGSGLTLIALGGEAVVDYAIRFAREFPTRRIWAAGYSNDVFGYLPSRRIREEGGYEGADAMIYYGRPGPFTADVEERIVREVRRLAR
jgi:neutral ceramidase